MAILLLLRFLKMKNCYSSFFTYGHIFNCKWAPEHLLRTPTCYISLEPQKAQLLYFFSLLLYNFHCKKKSYFPWKRSDFQVEKIIFMKSDKSHNKLRFQVSILQKRFFVFESVLRCPNWIKDLDCALERWFFTVTFTTC